MIDEKKLIDELIRKDQSLQEHLKHKDNGNELFNFGLKSQLAMLKSIISCVAKQPKTDKWIPCSDRLPENKRTVLMCGVAGWMKIGWYDRACWWTGFSLADIKDNVIAWQPLPEPYKPNNPVAVEKNRKTKPKMNEDIEGFLIEKKSLYQKRITRLEKQEHNIHGFLECEPGREDVIEDLNTVVKLQDRYNALIDFITELQESYF